MCLCVVKSDVERRLMNAETALMLQEDAIRHGDRELRQLLDKLNSLEQELSAAESDKIQLLVSNQSRVY